MSCFRIFSLLLFPVFWYSNNRNYFLKGDDTVIPYRQLNFPFSIEQTSFSACNLTFGTFSSPMPEHSHGPGSYEIHYIPQGHGTVHINGKVFAVCPGTLYVTGPGVVHSQYPYLEDPMQEYCIYLQAHLFAAKKSRESNQPSRYLSRFLSTYFWLGQDTQEVGILFQKIFYELRHRFSGYTVQVEALLKQMVVALVRNYEQCREDETQFQEKTPDAHMALIAEECFLYEYASLTLSDLASRIGLSPRQTERFLKRQYGKTFLQMRSQARMAAAASFLSDSDLSVLRISEMLGYSQVEHFSHAFRRYYGISAREYRKQHRR